MSQNQEDINRANEWFAAEDARKAEGRTTTNYTFDPKVYFQPSLKQGEDQKSFTVRILPPLGEEKELFMKRRYHKVETRVFDFDSKQIIAKEVMVNCAKPMGGKCALCDTGYEMFKSGKEAVEKGDTAKGESLKKEAQKYFAKDAYVVRVIDRSDEDYGVKFWSFDEFKNGGGIYDMLKLKAQRNGDFTDVENGYDLILDKFRGKAITIDVAQKSPLTTDEAKKAKWLGETRRANDIWKYKEKHEKYLEFIASETPCILDKETKEWVEFVPRQQNEEIVEETNKLVVKETPATEELPTQKTIDKPQPVATIPIDEKPAVTTNVATNPPASTIPAATETGTKYRS